MEIDNTLYIYKSIAQYLLLLHKMYSPLVQRSFHNFKSNLDSVAGFFVNYKKLIMFLSSMLFLVVVIVSIKYKNKTAENHHIRHIDYCVLNVSDPLIEYQCTSGRCDAELYINDSCVSLLQIFEAN